MDTSQPYRDEHHCMIVPMLRKFVNRIRAGRQHYDFRRRRTHTVCSRAIIMDIGPNPLCVGEFVPGHVIQGEQNYVWQETKRTSGLFRAEWEAYFEGRKMAYAMQITHPFWYSEDACFHPMDVFNLRDVPRSIVYVHNPPWAFGTQPRPRMDGPLFERTESW